MKKAILLFSTIISLSTFSQIEKGIIGENNWFKIWTNFKPKTTDYPVTNQILSGVIDQNLTLENNKTYLLSGMVYITNGATLTIQPGTIIKGDFDTTGTLVITKGAKINAEGTVTNPIVFTSNKNINEKKPGDWGGVILMGDAPLNIIGGKLSSIYDVNEKYNSFGGENIDSDSGILKFVRIEYAGKKVREKYLLNGLTLSAVGRKTIIDHIMISFSNDDSLEAVGGNVDLSNIISYKCTDDDFDFSFGFQTTMSNSIAIRYPFVSDVTRSRCFEIDSYDKRVNYDMNKKFTLIKLKNVTLVNNEENDQGLVKEAISLKTDSFLEMENCVVTGFQSVIALDNGYIENENYKKIKLKNTIIDNCLEFFTNETFIKAETINELFVQPNMKNTISNYGATIIFINNDPKTKPDFRLKK